ncbi:hypothetical protein DMP17_00170 [Pseudonocardia sp. TMWB2A]|uniref:hypothetical protein n=1 Tax=Pseudonocardia sp. TMWB2A TaxID=687430 RepID=UPI00307F845C
MSNSVNLASLSNLASSSNVGGGRSRSSNWFEAFAAAWGEALDNQATRIETQSNLISGEDGMDKPSEITKLTAESMRLSFMANSSHTSLDSVSKALETMARKG